MPSTPTSPKAASRTAATAPKPRLSIRTRLIVLALLILVPLMLDRVRLLEATRSERIESAHAEVLDIAARGVAGGGPRLSRLHAKRSEDPGGVQRVRRGVQARRAVDAQPVGDQLR